MPYEREGYAPWSLTREAGVQSATVNGTIPVPQYVQPTLSTGFIDEKGNWQGSKSSDENFIGITKALAIPNTATVLFPDTANFSHIDMTGFQDINIAIKVTNGGAFAIRAQMGPDTVPYANLQPVNPASNLKGTNASRIDQNVMYELFADTSETLAQDVWNIFMIMDRLRNQKNMQFQIQNNSGAETDIEFGFLRIIK